MTEIVFDWIEYQRLADALAEADLNVSKEAKYRAAVSRYYCAAYHYAALYAVRCGFKPSGRGDDHENVTDYLSKYAREDSILQSVNRLRVLRTNRNRCDYSNIVENIDRVLEISKSNSYKIIDIFKKESGKW